MALIKTEKPGIYKERDGILINKDEEGLHAYKKQKMQALKIKAFEEDLINLKEDISEIKTLLKALVK